MLGLVQNACTVLVCHPPLATETIVACIAARAASAILGLWEDAGIGYRLASPLPDDCLFAVHDEAHS